MHLASIATKESQALRGAAEQRIADFVKAETAGIEARQQELRRQVEVLWKTYRDHLNTMQQEPGQQAPNVVRSPVSRGGTFGPGGLGVAMSSSPSVTVKNFHPVPISPVLSPPSSVPRMSALSASLATSTFHHPKANQARSRSPVHSSGSYGSTSSRTLSTHSKSSTLVPDAVPVGSNVLQFRRNINDTINTQASYKYFVNLEEDMARYKRSQEEAMKQQQQVEAVKRAHQAGPSQVTSGTNTNGNLKVKITPTDEEIISSRGRDKGKRKVTFDVEPAVMTIKTEDDGKVEEDVTTVQDPQGKPIMSRRHMKCANLDVLQKWCLYLTTRRVKKTLISQMFDIVLFLFLNNNLCLVRFDQESCARRTASRLFHPFGPPHCLTPHIPALCEVNLMSILHK